MYFNTSNESLLKDATKIILRNVTIKSDRKLEIPETDDVKNVIVFMTNNVTRSEKHSSDVYTFIVDTIIPIFNGLLL